jgi:phage I-like protein
MSEATYALTTELPPSLAAPEWVMLLPPGREIAARDGRAWVNDRPQAILAAFDKRAMPLPLDWEHATELRATQGEPAPAAGWIDRLEVRTGGALWGHVDWTPRGRAAVVSREYRFLSPVFLFERASMRILELTSAALTNRPALHLKAIARAQAPAVPFGALSPLAREICRRTGVSESDFWREKRGE